MRMIPKVIARQRQEVPKQEVPNAETIAVIEAVARGEVNTYATADDFYNKLGL